MSLDADGPHDRVDNPSPVPTTTHRWTRFALPAAASLVVSLVWGVLAWPNPTTTYLSHTSPLRWWLSSGRSRCDAPRWSSRRRPALLGAGLGVTVSLAATVLLALAGRRRGPALWGSDVAAAEAVLIAILGAAYGTRAAVARKAPWYLR